MAKKKVTTPSIKVTPQRGGFQRPLRIGEFVRDFLRQKNQSHAAEIYQGYKEEAEKIPLSRRRGGPYAKRKVISYHGFLTYMYMFRRLGLIEYVKGPNGEVVQRIPMDSSHGGSAPWLAPVRFVQIAAGRDGDTSWLNPWLAYRGY